MTCCVARLTMQLLVQPLGVESDCSVMNAVPVCAPACVVLSPTERAVLAGAPGANWKMVPLFVSAAPVAGIDGLVEVPICALRLACGAVVATFCTEIA